MKRRVYEIAIIGVLLIGCQKEKAMQVEWPELSQFQCVSGRAPMQDDVRDGRAVFLAKSGDVYIGQSLNIQVPQYAYHVDGESGRRTRCVIIQAEEAGGQKLVGAIQIADGAALAGLLSEFELLGREKPKK